MDRFLRFVSVLCKLGGFGGLIWSWSHLLGVSSEPAVLLFHPMFIAGWIWLGIGFFFATAAQRLSQPDPDENPRA